MKLLRKLTQSIKKEYKRSIKIILIKININ
jgi:hypothetical protein